MYKITNTTVKPYKKNDQNQDVRSVLERTGYGIQLVIPGNPPEYRTLYQPGRSTIVDKITQEMQSMSNKKIISIEKIDDNLIGKTDNTNLSVPEPVKAPAEPQLKAHASFLGEDSHRDQLVNPDGDPPVGKVSKIVQKKKDDVPVSILSHSVPTPSPTPSPST